VHSYSFKYTGRTKIITNYDRCHSNPIPTWLFKQCASVLVCIITNTVNLSLTSGQFHPILKESVISPLLQKSPLDKDQLSNYHPISNLSSISKITERVVKSHLTDHLTSNKLLNRHQSAYCKHHSIETALLYIQRSSDQCNRVTNKLPRLCLLDLSAAFATDDHSILLAFHHGSISMAPSSTDSSCTCHPASSV